MQELAAATVNELIEKIVIHSPERIGGKKHVTIEVYFAYVGRIRIPLVQTGTIDGYGKTGVTSATPVIPEISFTSLWDAAQCRSLPFTGYSYPLRTKSFFL